jgi:hypothetical protein
VSGLCTSETAKESFVNKSTDVSLVLNSLVWYFQLSTYDLIVLLALSVRESSRMFCLKAWLCVPLCMRQVPWRKSEFCETSRASMDSHFDRISASSHVESTQGRK